MVKSSRRSFLLGCILSVCLTLSACAPTSSERLPDDESREPIGQAPTQPPSDMPPLPPPPPPSRPPQTEDQAILAQYAHLDPQRVVPTLALQQAVLYFHRTKSSFPNQRVISILDFHQSSTEKRFHIVNLSSGAVWSLHVSHGRGSDRDHDGFAESFSNVMGSNATSLGYYRTAETYMGENGYSLRLDGLSPTNSQARVRAIVIHGADYVQDRPVIQGRSWGCPAISYPNHRTLIDLVKGGSLISAIGGSSQSSLR